MDRKQRVFIRYLIGPREFAQRASVRDFIGPFTISCEALTRMVSKRRANMVIGGSIRDTVSGPTQLFLLEVVIDQILILSLISLMLA